MKLTHPQKFSPQTKQALLAAQDVGGQRGSAQIVNVLLSLRGPLAPPERQRLKQVVLGLGAQAGDIITARVLASQLHLLGELDFVRYIELGTPLFLEEPNNEEQRP